MTDNIVAGIVSGLLATFCIVVLRSLWLRIAVPWFEERVYKDIRIEGAWFALYPTIVGNRKETIHIERHGHEVTATMICSSGKDQGEQYVASGSFRNLILTLAYETRDRSRVDRGSITLRCVRNGKRLQGKIAIYHDPSDSIDVNDLIWFRSKDDLEDTLGKIRQRQELAETMRTRDIEARKNLQELIQKHMVQKPEADRDTEHSEEANQSPQRNAGSRPPSGDSPASETPSSLGPRG